MTQWLLPCTGDQRGEEDGGMMRSQYASDASDTYVELEFQTKGGRYGIRRSPAYGRRSRKKNREGPIP